MMRSYVTKEYVCDLFRSHCQNRFNSQQDAASYYGVTKSFISAIWHYKKYPNSEMLAEMGYRKAVCFEDITDCGE